MDKLTIHFRIIPSRVLFPLQLLRSIVLCSPFTVLWTRKPQIDFQFYIVILVRFITSINDQNGPGLTEFIFSVIPASVISYSWSNCGACFSVVHAKTLAIWAAIIVLAKVSIKAAWEKNLCSATSDPIKGNFCLKWQKLLARRQVHTESDLPYLRPYVYQKPHVKEVGLIRRSKPGLNCLVQFIVCLNFPCDWQLTSSLEMNKISLCLYPLFRVPFAYKSEVYHWSSKGKMSPAIISCKLA